MWLESERFVGGEEVRIATRLEEWSVRTGKVVLHMTYSVERLGM